MMAATLAASSPPPRPLLRRDSIFVALGTVALAVLYGPVFVEYGPRYFWDEDDNHSGILLLMTCYAFFSDRASFAFRSTHGEARAGHVLTLIALLSYLVGRVADIVQFQGLSIAILAMGLTLGFGGREQLKRWWGPCLLLVFIVPWAGSAFDSLLVPTRLLVTGLAVDVVRMMGYPVAASGVIISVGFVELTVAGACVGLRSLISTLSIAALFLFFFPPRSLKKGLLFMAGACVIALAANFIRVVTLIFVAAEMGAGATAYVHDVAAYLEVFIAMGCFLMLAKAIGLGEDAAGIDGSARGFDRLEAGQC